MGQVAKDFMKSLEISQKHRISHHELVWRKKIKVTVSEILMPVNIKESASKKQLDALIEKKKKMKLILDT